MLALLRTVTSFAGISKTRKPMPVCRAGWNGLPEDVFHSVVKEHLDCDVATVKSLSTTCQAYAAFSRSYIFQTVRLTSAQALHEFGEILNRYPWLITVEGESAAPALTQVEEDFMYIFSQEYAQLMSLELPPLSGTQQWAMLSNPIKDAISSFLLRHHLQLEEVSITTHYPLGLVSSCSTLQKLECKIFPDTSPAMRLEDRPTQLQSLTDHHYGDNTMPLRELVIQDPYNLASSFIPQLIDVGSCVNATALQSLTYYGNDAASTQLSSIFVHCADTLSTLKLFIGEEADCPYLEDVLDLPRLSHITLAIDVARRAPGARSQWLHNTLSVLIIEGHISQNEIRLQDIHIIIRAHPGVSQFAEVFGLSWQTVCDFVRTFDRVMEDANIGFPAGDAPIRHLQSLRVSVAVEKDYTPTDGPGNFTECTKYIWGIAVMDFVEDKYNRWPRFSKDEGEVSEAGASATA
ncbi:hypothetical protein NMY22_g10422 [Coprinellus aureogranulatus]|nr:hypothetical protein NMY22_g10422 [Coprinellus aureogranulatus]